MAGVTPFVAFAAGDSFSIGRPAPVPLQGACFAPHDQQTRRELDDAKRGVLSKHMQGRPELAVLMAELSIGMTETDEALLAKSIEKIEKLPKTINTGDTSIHASLLLSQIRNDLDAFSAARKELSRRNEQSSDMRDSILLRRLGALIRAIRIEADGTEGESAQVLRQEALVLAEKSLVSAKKINSKTAIREVKNMHSHISALMAGYEQDSIRLASIIDAQRNDLDTDLSSFEQSEQIRILIGSLYSYASMVRGQRGSEALQELNGYIERVKILDKEIQKSMPTLNLATRALEAATGRRTVQPNGMDSVCISNSNLQLMQAMVLVLQQFLISQTERPDPVVLNQALMMLNKVEIAFSLQPKIYRPQIIELFRSRVYSLLAITENVPERRAQWIVQAKQQLKQSKERLDSCFCSLARKELLREEVALNE